MSDPSNLSFHINLEFLRKEAKSLLKQCRSRDSATLNRIRAGLPRIAGLADERAAAEIKLADVQYALAREQGYPSWGVLKLRGIQEGAMPDFSRPGADGTLPEGFTPWRWSVTYTVRADFLPTLADGKECRITISQLRKVPSGETFRSYEDLYNRATAIANARIAQLRCTGERRFLQKRILKQGWFRHGDTQLVRAFLTLGVACLNEGDERTQGEQAPTPKELKAPRGITPEDLAAASAQVQDLVYEIYTDSDVRDPSDSTGILLISYGEYVETCSRIDYEPFVKRAERLSRFHRSFLTESEAFKIVRREWFCATNPDIAVVHLYIHAQSRL